MFGTDFLRKLSRLTIIAGLLIGLCDPASAYDPKAKQVSLNTSNFDNNLDGTVNDVQELADAVDELSTSTPETDPVVAAISGIVKSNGTTISAAVSGTDYAPATSGTAILKGNGSGGFSSASAGVDYLASETDGVIGNEVTGATDGSLTRSGGGAGGSPYTLALNVSNANTWTGQQTFNTSAPVFGTMTPGSTFFAGSGGLLSQDNQNFRFDDTTNRLSIFTTLGNEIVTNGTFTSNASGWTVPSGMAYSSGAVSKTSNGTGALTQSTSHSLQREYLLTYTISNWTVGTITPTIGGFTGTAVSANGTYTERFVATSTAALTFTPSNTARFTIDTISLKPLVGTNTASNLNVGGFSIQGSWSNGTPGTTRGMTYNNDGSYSWIDYRFAGTLRAATGANSSGGYDIYQSGGNGVAFYQGNSGLTSNSIYMYATSTALVHYGYGEFYGGVIAGALQQPTSTLQTEGGLALNVKRITASQSLDNTATHWLMDATTASACSGTASTACSTYTNSTDCGARSNHGGGCSWYAGSDCSTYNNESGMGQCTGTSGCTAETGNCSGGDESTCLAGDDTYGGSCAWNSNDCSPLDEATCSSYSGSGCSTNYSDCSSFNGNEAGCSGQSGCSVNSSNTCPSQMDEGSCVSAGCSWDGMTCTGDNSTCTGTYYTGCSGTYYTCSGTYYTGTCSGTFGAACSGTPSCGGISNSTDCGNEAGCTWSSVLNATLPDGETCPDRTYWIYNDSSGGADVVIYPYSGQTVNETTSYTLANYRDWIHLAYFKQTKDCSLYLTEGACTPTGCSPSYTACSWDSMSSDCSGAAACDAADSTDQATCNAITYFSSCSGTEIIRKNWYKFGS